MPQIIDCTNPRCGKKMTVSDELLGRVVHCPHCVQRIQAGPKLAHRPSEPLPIIAFAVIGGFIAPMATAILFLGSPAEREKASGVFTILTAAFIGLMLFLNWNRR